MSWSHGGFSGSSRSDPVPATTEAGRRLRSVWVEMVAIRRRANGLPETGSESLGPRLDGGRDRSGRQFRPVWDDLAERCQSYGADPAEVAAYLFYCEDAERVPDPRRLADPEVVQAVRARREAMGAAVGPQLVSDQAAFAVARRAYSFRFPNPTDAFIAALQDASASPLFRFAVAADAARRDGLERWPGLAAVLERLAHPAAVQFGTAATEYRRLWRALLTDDILGDLQRYSKSERTRGARDGRTKSATVQSGAPYR